MSGYEALHNLLNEYLHFVVEGKEVKVPYVLQFSIGDHSRTSGKGTPEMLKKELLQDARIEGFDLKIAQPKEIFAFMKQQRIGIECSGLVFQLANAYVKTEKGVDLSTEIYVYRGMLGRLEHLLRSSRRYRNANAKTLTSDINTVKIEKVRDIKVADLIRMSTKREADHVLIVVDVKRDSESVPVEIIYAHSSSVNTRKRGPHTGVIKVIDANEGLEKQEWFEQTKTGESYKKFFRPEKGDSIRRLKVLL